MLDDFRRIVESATPQPIQSRLVTPDEAKAVIGSYNRLTDPLRSNFLALPIENIIEFSMLQTKKRPSLYSYMNSEQAIAATEPLVEAPQGIPEPERDQIDQPAQTVVAAPEPAPMPIVEERPKRSRKPRLAETKPEAPADDERFFTRLIERLEQLAAPPAKDANVEKLLEVEKGVLVTINRLTEKIERLSTGADSAREGLTEMMAIHRDMLTNLNETQTQMSAIQTKLIESQAQIVETIGLLADKIALFSQTPPVVNPVINVPAPIVNVTTQEGRRTKVVERDENNLITRIIEGYEAE